MTVDDPRVRHRAPNVFDRSTLIEDAATFYTNNKIYEGWKNVSVNRTLNSLSGSFSLTVLDKLTIDDIPWQLKPGNRAHLHLGKNALFEGYIDNLDVGFSANSRNMTIQGRDRTADLVDCSATGQNEYRNLNLTEIATKLCEPFGIRVLTLSEVGEKFPTISIKPGEKVFEVLNRLSRQRGLLLYSSTHGNLIISAKGSSRAATELIQGQNILSASATFDNTERYSQYTIKSQNDGLIGSKPSDAAQAEGQASDPGMTRFRPLTVVSEASGTNTNAKSRAEWEATFRAAKAMTIKVKLQGWREKNGALWDINKLVHLNAKNLGVNDQFLINAVNYNQAENRARTCDLELVRKDAYDSRAIVSTEADPLQELGS